jgi:hypothetical protein
MAAVESRELVGAAHSNRISQMRRDHESQREREQKAEQHLEDAWIIQILRRQVRVALDKGRRFTESCERVNKSECEAFAIPKSVVGFNVR